MICDACETVSHCTKNSCIPVTQADIHSCSYFCEKTACIKRQRDELRERVVVRGEPVAWQWLDTSTFRKRIPASAEPSAWIPLYTTPVTQTPQPVKLWLWKNFVNGNPEYWAFDNECPIQLDNDGPQTVGNPCGYALVMPSRNGRPNHAASVAQPTTTTQAPQPVTQPLTDAQVELLIIKNHFDPTYKLKASDRTILAWYRLGVRDGERAHGITSAGDIK